MNKEEILGKEVFDYIFSEGTQASNEKYNEYVDRARELKVFRAFDAMYKKVYKRVRGEELNLDKLKTYSYDKSEYKIPYGFKVDTAGIWKYNDKADTYILIYDRPLLINKIYEDIDTQEIRYGLVDVGNKNVIIKSSVINDTRGLAKLNEEGILILISSLSQVSDYLVGFIKTNESVLNVEKSSRRFGWIDDKFDKFMPYTDVDFVGKDGSRDRFKAMTNKGEYEAWKKEVRDCIEYNDSLRMYVCASFGSVLLPILGKQGFVVHLYGNSEIGKTVAMYIAMSVWGDPTKLCVNFNTTRVGMERNASLHYHVPLAVDEGELANDYVMSFENFVYMISQGQGKGRGTKDDDLREEATWNLISLTNAEKSILEGGSKEGMSNRIIELTNEGSMCKDLIKSVEAVRGNYGHAGREFVEKIINGDISIEKIRAIHKDLYAMCYDNGNKASKQSLSYAVLLLADVLMNHLIFGVELEKAISNTKEMFLANSSVVKSKDEINPTRHIFADILDWISENNFNFYRRDGMKDIRMPHNKCYGVIAEDETYVICKTLKDYLKSEGYSANKVLKEMGECGLLEKNEKGELHIQKKIAGTNSRCYVIQNRKVEKVVEIEEYKYKQEAL